MTRLQRDAPWALPLVVMAIVLLQHTGWLSLHTALETWDDDAGLFQLAMCLQDDSAGAGVPCAVGAPYPPLVPWITSLFFRFAGESSLQTALFSLWPFLVVLCGSLFVGVRRAATPMAGLAAMTLGPVLVWSLHIRGKYYTEIPLAALVVAAVVALAASDMLRRRGPSVLFGVTLGLGLLTKWSFAFFLGPVAAGALTLATARSLNSRVHGFAAAAAVLAVPLLVLAGAAGWVPYGITAGFWLGISLAVLLVGITAKAPQFFAPQARTVLLNVGLVALVCVLIAGPWYWRYLPTMQEFLAANLAQKFHGDPVSGLAGWPFYPAVLFTRMMSTPMLLLALLGGVLSLRRGAHPLLRWSVIALVSGTVILGVLPYRAGRYLVPGTGLLSIIAVLGLVRFDRLARVALPMTVGLGLAHQLSWIPMAAGGSVLPHHIALFTLPEPDLMGNTRGGIYTAYQDLLHPKWRFLPVASPPIHGRSLSEWVAERVDTDAGSVPSLTVVSDRASRLNLNAMSTHLAARRPPPTTKIVAEVGGLNRSSLAMLRARARKPRDQPATASGPAAPRQLYIVLSYAPSTGPDTASVALLKASGFRLLASTGMQQGPQSAGLTIWRASSR
jgi:hypothetical protein